MQNAFFRRSWLKLIYFNFRMLPFKQALKFPFDFCGRVRFENLRGRIILDIPNLKRGMIKIGGRGSEMFSRAETILDIKGTVTFAGKVELGHGVLLRVESGGEVYFGNDVRIGAMSKIFAEDRIEFGNEIDFSWECQIFDTNFHFIRNRVDGSVKKKTAPVRIGSFNWFGNRVTVMKGTVTPDYTTIASNSLCNKDYTGLGEYTIIAGTPAGKIAVGFERIFENLEDVSQYE